MTEEETLQKLNILGIYDPPQLEEEDLNMWWQKKYKEIKDSQLKEETIKEKLIEINEIYEELSKVDEKLLVEIINKKSKEENKVDSYIDLYKLGLELFNKEEYQKSIQKLSIAIDLNANYQYNFNLRACAYYNLKNYDKAIEDATKAIDLNSDDPINFNLRASAYYNLKNYDKAIEDATMAIDLNSDDPDIYFLREDSLKHLRLGKIYEHFNNKDYEKTIIQCNKEISSNNLIPDFFNYRGLAKWYSDKVHKNRSILEDFDIAIRMDPENSDFYRNRGELKLEI